MSYKTYEVQFEHTTENSDNVRQNRAVITCWAGGEFKIRAEIMKQNPSYKDVNILDVTER